jgi:trans-aconitate methyltransferase
MHHWNPEHYDNNLSYVSEFGKQVVGLLNPQHGERILDLGCGTGDLSYEISQSGATVFGIDLSLNMIEQAKEKYPNLHFEVANAEDFSTEEQFDAVFSNAALHWMKRPSNVIQCVWDVLRSGGRFVAEFGGKGNVDSVIKALEIAPEELGITAKERNPWFFPSIGEYASLLERQGFRTTYVVHFDRPTLMNDKEKGLEHWLNGFAEDYLYGLGELDRWRVIQRVVEITRSRLFKDGQWFVDYKRIRVVATKDIS